MKIVALAFLVVLVVSQSEGLKCFCGGNRICSDSIETCSAPTDACGNLLITAGSKPTHSRGCVVARDCMMLNKPGLISCRSCKFDLCNR